jgi:hypothetical protein
MVTFIVIMVGAVISMVLEENNRQEIERTESLKLEELKETETFKNNEKGLYIKVEGDKQLIVEEFNTDIVLDLPKDQMPYLEINFVEYQYKNESSSKNINRIPKELQENFNFKGRIENYVIHLNNEKQKRQYIHNNN